MKKNLWEHPRIIEWRRDLVDTAEIHSWKCWFWLWDRGSWAGRRGRWFLYIFRHLFLRVFFQFVLFISSYIRSYLLVVIIGRFGGNPFPAASVILYLLLLFWRRTWGVLWRQDNQTIWVHLFFPLRTVPRRTLSLIWVFLFIYLFCHF